MSWNSSFCFSNFSNTSICSLAFMLFQNITPMTAQNIYPGVPENIDPNHTYLFYLHGAIVQQQGADAISDKYGPYEYANIVGAFAELGYQVISEVRPKDSEIPDYANKITYEVSELLKKGVPSENIVVVGASMGGYITIETAYNLENKDLKYAVLGVCSDYAFKYFSNREQDLCGDFFSIYETSDQPGTCNQLLNNSKCPGNFKEVALSMGNGHGFLYKPYPDWMEPLSEWINGN